MKSQRHRMLTEDKVLRFESASKFLKQRFLVQITKQFLFRVQFQNRPVY